MNNKIKMSNNIETTLKERGSRYGTFESNAVLTQALMAAIECHPEYEKLSPVHVEAFHMIFHKISRCICGDAYYKDTIHDISGYAKCLEEYIDKTSGL